MPGATERWPRMKALFIAPNSSGRCCRGGRYGRLSDVRELSHTTRRGYPRKGAIICPRRRRDCGPVAIALPGRSIAWHSPPIVSSDGSTASGTSCASRPGLPSSRRAPRRSPQTVSPAQPGRRDRGYRAPSGRSVGPRRRYRPERRGRPEIDEQRAWTEYRRRCPDRRYAVSKRWLCKAELQRYGLHDQDPDAGSVQLAGKPYRVALRLR